MGKVLIVDVDSTHAGDLVDELETVKCRVLVCAEQEEALNAIRMEHVDLVVVVPASPSQWRKNAESLCDATRQLEYKPQIIFVLRCQYMGPSERLYGDRLRIKVLYER